MATSGEGTGTPITGGTPGASFNPVEPLPYTLLSLPRYARIMGINPVHFAGGHTTTQDQVWPLADNRCEDIWPRYAWQQSDIVSHQEIAQEIQRAEEDIARVLGYHPAPRWISREMHPYPQFHRHELKGAGGYQHSLAGAQRKSLRARWGKIISAGQRAVTLIATATTSGGTLTYQDLDGDGYFETAEVAVATTESLVNELKVFHEGEGGDQRWEIRDARSVVLSGGVATFLFDSWLFIQPGLHGAYPTSADFQAIRLDNTDNLVSSVDVYREYNNTAAVNSTFYWEPVDCAVCASCAVTLESGGNILLETGETSSSCPICGFRAQDGCLLVRDVETGIVMPAPASFSTDDSAYVITSFAVGYDPDQVRIYYYAGDVDEYRLQGTRREFLSERWARVIAYMATARIQRPMCSCANVTTFALHLREDLAHSGDEGSFLLDFNSLGNPFGTRRGEFMAWREANNSGEAIIQGYAI